MLMLCLKLCVHYNNYYYVHELESVIIIIIPQDIKLESEGMQENYLLLSSFLLLLFLPLSPLSLSPSLSLAILSLQQEQCTHQSTSTYLPVQISSATLPTSSGGKTWMSTLWSQVYTIYTAHGSVGVEQCSPAAVPHSQELGSVGEAPHP